MTRFVYPFFQQASPRQSRYIIKVFSFEIVFCTYHIQKILKWPEGLNKVYFFLKSVFFHTSNLTIQLLPGICAGDVFTKISLVFEQAGSVDEADNLRTNLNIYDNQIGILLHHYSYSLFIKQSKIVFKIAFYLFTSFLNKCIYR